MGEKGVTRCYVTLLGYATAWLIIHHVYGYDGYPWGVCILMVLLYSSQGQIPTNRLHLPMNRYQHP